MKTLLAICAACLAAAGIQPVRAQETRAVWLVMRVGPEWTPALFTIPTADMEQCEMSGAQFIASKRFSVFKDDGFRFECLEGIR